MGITHGIEWIKGSPVAALVMVLAIGACQTGGGGGAGGTSDRPPPDCAALGEECTDADECCDAAAGCVDGTCEADGGGGGGSSGSGDVAAGQAIYETDCMGCHAVPGTGGGFGPDLQGATAEDLEAGSQADDHPFDASSLAEDDFDDLEAFLAEDDGGVAASYPSLLLSGRKLV